jgi:hypothetical protein
VSQPASQPANQQPASRRPANSTRITASPPHVGGATSERNARGRSSERNASAKGAHACGRRVHACERRVHACGRRRMDGGREATHGRSTDLSTVTLTLLRGGTSLRPLEQASLLLPPPPWPCERTSPLRRQQAPARSGWRARPTSRDVLPPAGTGGSSFCLRQARSPLATDRGRFEQSQSGALLQPTYQHPKQPTSIQPTSVQPTSIQPTAKQP